MLIENFFVDKVENSNVPPFSTRDTNTTTIIEQAQRQPTSAVWLLTVNITTTIQVSVSSFFAEMWKLVLIVLFAWMVSIQLLAALIHQWFQETFIDPYHLVTTWEEAMKSIFARYAKSQGTVIRSIVARRHGISTWESFCIALTDMTYEAFLRLFKQKDEEIRESSSEYILELQAIAEKGTLKKPPRPKIKGYRRILHCEMETGFSNPLRRREVYRH